MPNASTTGHHLTVNSILLTHFQNSYPHRASAAARAMSTFGGECSVFRFWLTDPRNPEAAWEAVTGEMPVDLPEPEAGAVIEMAEYFFEISEGALTAGQQVLELQNVGEQLHFLDAGMIPNEVTEEDIAEVLEIEQQAELTGTPPVFTDFNPEEDYQPYLSTGTQSGGTTIWAAVTLDPGTYVLVCFFPDTEDGLPHAYHGQYAVVEVEE